MPRQFYRLVLRATGAALLVSLPLVAQAQEAAAAPACPAPAVHSLPKATGTSPTTVFSLGVQGGSVRPWSIKVMLDGTISATGTNISRQQLPDPKNSLRGLLALSDSEGFFSLKKSVGCLGSGGNPDVSSRFISIRTTKGAKRVNEFGSCAATSKFDQMFAVLQAAAGYGS